MKNPKEYYETYIKYATISQRETLKPFTEDITELVGYIKSEIQNIAASHWLANQWGVIQIGTGVGKTKIGVFVGDHYANPQNTTLITVPRETLRDTEWPNEFNKWGKDFSNITIECHNTTVKRKGEKIHTLIVDEAHHLLSPKGIAFLRNNIFERILMLTATIPKNKQKILKELGIPIVYSYPIEQGEEDGIVSANSRYTLEVELTQEERKDYDKINTEIDKVVELCLLDPRKTYTPQEKEIALANKGRCFAHSQLVLQKKALFPGKGDQQSMNLAIKYTKLINERKNCVYYTIAKINAFDKLIKELIIPNEDQAITFGEKTDIVDMLYESYREEDIFPLFGKFHSELKTKEKNSNLNAFREGEKKILLSAKALREGMNIPSVKYGLSLGGTSSELDTQQEEGRTFRWVLGKHAIFINIVCKNTVEMNWLKKSYQNRKIKPMVFDDVDKLIKHIQDEEYERSRDLALS